MFKLFLDKSLAHDGRVVLTDFGLSKIIGATIHTVTMRMGGTPNYMAPEQALTDTAGLHTDIYSLGVVLFELLTGQLPFKGVTAYATIEKHVRESPPRLSNLRPDLPRVVARGLDRVLFKAMAKDPADRFQTVDEFEEALNAAFEGRPIPHVSMRPRLSPVTRRRITSGV